jgi:hypothetical protein
MGDTAMPLENFPQAAASPPSERQSQAGVLLSQLAQLPHIGYLHVPKLPFPPIDELSRYPILPGDGFNSRRLVCL